MIWRFRLLVIAGGAAAMVLAVLSMVRVDPGGSPMLSYRNPQVWISSARLFVTEPGFPWGRSRLEVDATSGTQSDPGRLTGLALLYATLADSDQVRRVLLKDGPIRGKIFGAPVLASIADGDPLPIIEVSATGTSPQSAYALTARAANGLSEYIRLQQQMNEITSNDRVVLQVINRPQPPKVLAGRSKALPALIFVGIFGLTIAAAFLLENVRPRAQVVPQAEVARRAADATTLRSA